MSEILVYLMKNFLLGNTDAEENLDQKFPTGIRNLQSSVSLITPYILLHKAKFLIFFLVSVRNVCQKNY